MRCHYNPLSGTPSEVSHYLLSVFKRGLGPGFVATNENPQTARVPRVILSLAHMYGRHYLERGLCPVWAINIYRAMTPNGPYPVGNDLLLHLPTPTVSMKSSVVAVWIKKCIELTYEAACLEVTAVSAHEVRAIANSGSGRICNDLASFWGRPEVDLMATASNRRCREFISPIPHPEALGVDAFAATWPVVKLAYVYPPASIVGRVIQLIRRQRPHRIILIASMAESRPFHAELREMAVSPPVPVAREFGTLVQQLSSEDRQRIHALPHLFQLGAWLLSAQ